MDRFSKNILVLTPVLMFIAAASYYLFQDYHVEPDENIEQQQEVIGEIISTENNVKRQLLNDVMWNPIATRTPVYNKDSVRTGKESYVVIKLKDTSIVELGENSLIVLEKNQQKLGVDLKAGDIATKNMSQNLNIKIKDTLVSGAGADLKVKTNSDKDAQISVAKGKAFITDKNKKLFQINEDEQADLSQEGMQSVSKIAIELRSPENRTQITNSRSDFKQPFTWEVLRPDVRSEHFEISKNPQFKPESTTVIKAHQAIHASLVQGINYWRVGWLSGGKMLYSETRQIILGQDKRLELIYPENNSQYDITSDEDNSIELQWKSQLQAKVFVMELSTAPDFKSIVATKALKETKTIAKDLGNHIYYWRVKAFGESNNELATSAPSTFTVKLKLPSLPELIRPENEAAWESNEAIDFSWQSVPKAKEYRITISRDHDQKQIVKTKTLESTLYKWDTKGQYFYFWSVKAINAQGSTIGSSEVRRLNVAPKAKGPQIVLIYPKDNGEVVRDQLTTDPEPILFQWQGLKTLPGPSSMVVAKDKDFKEVILKLDNLKQLSQSSPLNQYGTYFWKVTSESQDKEQKEESIIGTFKLKVSNAAMAPELIEPVEKEKIEFVEQNVPVKFSWKPRQPASQYHLVVERIDQKSLQKITVVDRVVKELTLTSNPLAEGIYHWSVSGLDEQGQEASQSKLGEFHITPQELMEAPQLNAPVIK